MQGKGAPGGPRIAHSSDLHIGGGRAIDEWHPLCRVVKTAQQAAADILVLAGDIFDHNRVPLAVLDSAARVMGDSGLRIVILPGNHDCLTADSVYRRGGIAEVPGVDVIGVTADHVVIPQLDLDVWGRAHYDYQNMSPLHDPQAPSARWFLAVAHGHWMKGPSDRHRGWLITDDDINSTKADYVALGHWPQAGGAGDGGVPAYYCGSPDLAGTINVVELGSASGAARMPLAPP